MSSAALKIARVRADGTFARMLVRIAERWIARVGTVSVPTRRVGMRGHDPHCLTDRIFGVCTVKG